MQIYLSNIEFKNILFYIYIKYIILYLKIYYYLICDDWDKN